MAAHSSILAWRIPWIEEPGGLRFIESQRVGHDLAHVQAHMYAFHLSNFSANFSSFDIKKEYTVWHIVFSYKWHLSFCYRCPPYNFFIAAQY